MGMYSEERNLGFDEETGVDMDALVEAFLIDDLTHNYGPDTIKEFCAPGGVGEALVEAKVLSNKRTIVRLSKNDDLKRRSLITVIQMAKQKNDPLYHKLVKYRVLWKQMQAKLDMKYGAKAQKVAIKGQKEYIKSMKGVNLTNSGTAQFITHDENR